MSGRRRRRRRGGLAFQHSERITGRVLDGPCGALPASEMEAEKEART